MSPNAFMLPALPQIPASGLNGTDTKGPAAFKSNPSGKSSAPYKSFSETLNRISERRYGGNPKATAAQKPRVTSRDSNTDSSSQKMSNTTDFSNDHVEEVETSGSKETAPSIHPLPGSTSAPDLSMLTDLIGHLHLQKQQVEDEQLGIGFFEQLQAGISPEATNRALFEQFASAALPQQDGEGVIGKTARLFEFWQWMFPSSSTAVNGTSNGQPESSATNGNASLNSLLQMLGMTGATSGINPDASSSHGPIMAAGQEGAHLNAVLLDRLLTPSQSAQTEISENTKIAVTGQTNAEALLEAQARQMSENSQRLEAQVSIKAAVEQAVNSNSVTEGNTLKAPEEVFDIKSAVQKSEILAVDTLGNKTSQIDGDSKDGGFLFSQDQMPQHLARLENAATSSETTPRSLMSQTLNQIVQKAVLSLHNGQHEIQLHLKPDFLGHVRMQIVSEGQHVAIKMVAEFPFVKDMLEHNLHQLRADLQAQGLNIDELEVSVAHDSQAGGDLHQNTETAKLQPVKNGTDFDDGSTENSGQTQSQNSGSMAETAIDYFA
jgi:flagellar hook-length control protein FliK